MCRACVIALFLLGVAATGAGTGRVVKVLPHFLDEEGRHALDASLYERDAYQAWLRDHPEHIHGLRFDIQWRSRDVVAGNLKLRVELIGINRNTPVRHTLEMVPQIDWWFSSWSSLELARDEYERLGRVAAWRVTLWEAERLLSAQESFLWSVADEGLPEAPEPVDLNRTAPGVMVSPPEP